MARGLSRGQIWLLERRKPDKRRPVLVLSRDALLNVLNTATVVAVTSTLRGSPTEVELGIEEGLKATSCANLCNLFTVPQNDLRLFVGSVSREKMAVVCRALRIATGCE